MKALEIINNINIHERVYKEAGLEVPPYRLTFAENTVLVKYAKEAWGIPDAALLSTFSGVEIEIVVPLEID